MRGPALRERMFSGGARVPRLCQEFCPFLEVELRPRNFP
jgi:hypothetical protein